MTHRAKSILDAAETAITGLTTTGNSVFRGLPPAAAQGADLPALFVRMGSDEPDPEQSAWPRLYSNLEIVIEGVIIASATMDDDLLQIREEVTKALRADYTLGLSYVQENMEGAAGAPEPGGETRQLAYYPMNWIVRYSRNWDDPST